MNALISDLLAGGPVLTDGAWGTELQARGLGLGEFPDLWNLTRPSAVAQVAAAYCAAGSQVILTNTFGANRLRLAEQMGAPTASSAAAEPKRDTARTGASALQLALERDVQAINRKGVEISRGAAAGRARVFASIGPSGKLLLNGDVTAEELSGAFAEQAEALAAAGADALLVESFSDLAETEIAVKAARQTGLPVVASMVFASGKDKDRTLMGATPEQVAAALTRAGVDVLGANCGQGIAGFVPICRRLRAATTLPIWIKANAGLPQVAGGRAHYAATPAAFAAYVPDLVRAGASFIGGCCGTNPEFIAAIGRCLRRS